MIRAFAARIFFSLSVMNSLRNALSVIDAKTLVFLSSNKVHSCVLSFMCYLYSSGLPGFKSSKMTTMLCVISAPPLKSALFSIFINFLYKELKKSWCSDK